MYFYRNLGEDRIRTVEDKFVTKDPFIYFDGSVDYWSHRNDETQIIDMLSTDKKSKEDKKNGQEIG